jgi:D-beta-D-heptose 7-phosphate kinase/D-beta-D-heptose 1-phosphate adenosyltransferase
MRLDYENPKPIAAAKIAELLATAEKQMEGCKIICLEDYNKGALCEPVCKQIIAMARQRKIPVIVDPASITDYSKYRGATALKLNRPEAQRATGLSMETPDQYQAAAEKLLTMLDLEAAIVTLDRHGAYLATKDGQRQWLKHARPRQVFDATGAGDMVLAMLAAARAAGASWMQAVALGNVAAGLEVERFGTVPITPDEIVQELRAEANEKLTKERTLEQVAVELKRHRAEGKRIVFTNGCFDLIHLGHVKYFQFARRQGDVLIVGVNTDASVRGLKGDKRPIVSEIDRLGVLEELESIDYLVRFDDPTPMRLIQAIRPDVLVKGADYPKEHVVGWELVESYGGHVALAPLVDGKSTSALIQRIVDTHK